MNKNLVTEFSTEWIKYSEYTTKKVPFGDEYIVPKKNAKPIKYKISEVADQMIMDYINIGKAFEFEKYKVKDMIIEFVKNYGLIGKPTQKLMIFSEEYGRECTYNIELGGN